MWKSGLVRRATAQKSVFLLVLSVLLLLPGDQAAAEQALGVSPGRVDRPSEIGDTCPTFSWGAAVGAESYRLVVYEMTQGAADRGKPVFTQHLPGTARSWTPDLEDCLARGETYIWFVRAEGKAAPSEWSVGRLFRTPAALGRTELAAALHEYLQSGGTLEELAGAAASGLASSDLAMANKAQPLPALFAPADDDALRGLSAADPKEEEELEAPSTAEAGTRGPLSNLGGGLASTTGGVTSAAVSGNNIQVGSETVRGYLGVQGGFDFDDIDFLDAEIDGDEIGVLGISQGGSDNFGVVGVGFGPSSAAGRFFNPTGRTEVTLGTDSTAGRFGHPLINGDVLLATADDGFVCNGCIGGDDVGYVESVKVECGPGCSVDFDDLCSVGFSPLAVDCTTVATGPTGENCNPITNDICSRKQLWSGADLAELCEPGPGWDALVYCLRD